MSYQLCRHVRTNGRRCKAASLTGNVWCFYHHRLHTSHQAYRHTEASRGYLIPGQNLELNTLEDRESVQLALSLVINALANGHLDPKRANTLLYGLQVASNNASNLDSRPGSDAVRTIDASPEGLALAEPVTLEPPIIDRGRDDDEDDDDYDDDEEGDDEDDEDDDDDEDSDDES